MLEFGFILLTLVSFAVAGSNAWTAKEIVKIRKKLTDPLDRASLKGMIWCKGSHGFHFVFSLVPMYLMAFGNHTDMIIGMYGMLIVSILAGLMSLMELAERISLPKPSVIVDKVVNQLDNQEAKVKDILTKIEEKYNIKSNVK